MAMKVRFVVPGEPRGKGRPRFKNGMAPYTPEKTANYESLIILEYHRQCKRFKFPDKAPLDMRLIAYYTIPKSASKKTRALMESHCIRPTKKPDNDNIIKIVQDALNTVAFRDDVQIVDCQLRKFYSNNPRLVVTIQEASYKNAEAPPSDGVVSAEQLSLELCADREVREDEP